MRETSQNGNSKEIRGTYRGNTAHKNQITATVVLCTFSYTETNRKLFLTDAALSSFLKF